jgi:uncharacterized protein (DUF427 family)
MKAIWNGKVIAESNDIVNLEGNTYFPTEAVNKNYIRKTQTHSVCPWKGTASYFDLEVDGRQNKDAAWYYPEPSEDAHIIKNRIAFWKGVQVVND